MSRGLDTGGRRGKANGRYQTCGSGTLLSRRPRRTHMNRHNRHTSAQPLVNLIRPHAPFPVRPFKKINTHEHRQTHERPQTHNHTQTDVQQTLVDTDTHTTEHAHSHITKQTNETRKHIDSQTHMTSTSSYHTHDHNITHTHAFTTNAVRTSPNELACKTTSNNTNTHRHVVQCRTSHS